MNIKKITILFVFFNCFVFTINAQVTNQNLCAEIKKANSFLSKNEILVVGGVFKPQIIKPNKFPITVSQSIATVGGFSNEANIKEIQIVQCSSDFSSAANIFFINFREINDRKENDLELKGGEIIYVPKTEKSVLKFKLISSELNSNR